MTAEISGGADACRHIGAPTNGGEYRRGSTGDEKLRAG